MANPLLSFLQGGGSANDPVMLASLRESRRRELEDQIGQGGDLARNALVKHGMLTSEMTQDPFTGREAQDEEAKKDALRETLFNYNRPDVRAMREEELAGKERLATAPARVAGQYNVQAAQEYGKERAVLAAEQRAALDARQAATQEHVTGRAQATQRGLFNRQRIAGLQSGKIKAQLLPAQGPMEWLFGPSQSRSNQAEIARLEAEPEPESDDTTQAVAAQIRAKFPTTPLHELIARGIVTGSPDELAALADAMQQEQ